MSIINGDYFSKRAGYIIERKTYTTLVRAKTFLMNACDMTDEEADRYLARLRYEKPTVAVEGGKA